MLALNFYKDFFEDSFLAETEEFFEKDSIEKIKTLNVTNNNISKFSYL